MKKHLWPNSIYWKNLFQYYLIVIGAIFLFSLADEEGSFDLLRGFIFVSVIAILVLGHRLAYGFYSEKRLEDKKSHE